ncbi:facilitated trehalose transporter Tret1-like [Amphibalanus amphitrite]|uniref:facilitated trehalose transporter Tret1-like n=1 Tax=Amphibalanus amphitrite TaxID=1232801 RepID=UPI001C90B025|nr:facilitated trehalose transporter Tret1-like [Amphibalanus amphitrite]
MEAAVSGPEPHGAPLRPTSILRSRGAAPQPQSILRNRDPSAVRQYGNDLSQGSVRTDLAPNHSERDLRGDSESVRLESVSIDSATSSRERNSDSVVVSPVTLESVVAPLPPQALPTVTTPGDVPPPSEVTGGVWRPLQGARDALRRGRHWWRDMSAKLADWAVLQDLRRLGDVEAANSRRARSLNRQPREGKASTRSARSKRSIRSTRSQGNILSNGDDEQPTEDTSTKASSIAPTSDRSRRTSSRLSIHDINRLDVSASECRSLSAGRPVPDLSTHDVSRRGIHLPQPQFELNGAVTLTPHVTLSRPSTPGPGGAHVEGPSSSGVPGHTRQPSLHRHRASAQLEELRSQPGSAGDTDGSGAASSSGAGTLSTLRTSWTSVTVPFGGTRRWKIRPQLLAVAAGCLTMLVTGFMMAYQSPANPQHVLTSGERRQNHLLAVGCLLGSLVGGVLLLAGRRRPLLAACLADAVIWTLPLFSSDPWLAYTAEILTGLVSCASILLVLVYVAEISVAECRGGFLVAALAAFDAGVLLCLLAAEVLGRRELAGLGLSLLLPLFAALVITLPESPRFVAAAGNKVGAEINLRLLRGVEYYSESELNLVLTNLDSGGVAGTNWLRVHTRQPALRALFVAGTLTFLVPHCGFSTVTSFAVGLFMGHGDRTQRTTLLCVTLIKMAATAASVPLSDRFGRRVPLLLASALQALALMVLALCALLLSAEQVYSVAGTVLLLLLVGVFVVGAGVGMSTLPWVLVAELFPQRSRPIGAALSGVAYWAGDLVAAWLAIWLQEALGASGVLWLHFLCTTVGYLFVFFVVPETREKALEEIEVYFTEKTSKKSTSRVPSVLITRL